MGYLTFKSQQAAHVVPAAHYSVLQTLPSTKTSATTRIIHVDGISKFEDVTHLEASEDITDATAKLIKLSHGNFKELPHLNFQPNYTTLGRKWGEDLGLVMKLLKSLPQDKLQMLKEGDSVTYGSFTIDSEDMLWVI